MSQHQRVKTATEMAILLSSITPDDPNELIDKLIEAGFFKTEKDVSLFLYESLLTSVENEEDVYPIHYLEE